MTTRSIIPLRPHRDSLTVPVPTVRLRAAMSLISRLYAETDGMIIEAKVSARKVHDHLEQTRGAIYTFGLITGHPNVAMASRALDLDFFGLQRRALAYRKGVKP